jgi:hypothetical protein
MHGSRGKVVVLSANPGSLLGCAGMLNNLGYYTISLCSHVSEIVALLETGRRFEYLVYDAFDSGSDAHALVRLSRYRAISSIIAISGVNSQQRQRLLIWARTHQVPLQGVLQTPLRSPELHELIGCNSTLMQ